MELPGEGTLSARAACLGVAAQLLSTPLFQGALLLQLLAEALGAGGDHSELYMV